MELIVIIFSVVATILSAGVFLAFSVAVNGGLARLEDEVYLKAMQNINRVILNPLFMLVFMGPVIALPLATLLYGGNVGSSIFMWHAFAAASYVLGVFGVTVAGNVPLNDRLEKFSVDDASKDERAAMRAAYQAPWNRLHAIRTVFAVLASIAIAMAAIS